MKSKNRHSAKTRSTSPNSVSADTAREGIELGQSAGLKRYQAVELKRADQMTFPKENDQKRVIEAMDAMVDAGLAHWGSSPCGLRALNLVTGEVYQLEAVRVRRIR